MRSVTIWAVSILLVAGALSATIAMMTVRWLYPEQSAATPQTSAPEHPPTTGSMERLAMDAVARIGGNLQPMPLRAAKLPAPDSAPTSVLVWAEYRREGKLTRGTYQVRIADGKAIALEGPVAPNGGYKPLPWEPLDEKARRIDQRRYAGRARVLVAPRTPEAGLAELLGRLQATYAPRGVDIILLLDMRAPDWAATARQAGFKGEIWRLKAELEDVPVVTQGRLMGAIGLLIDRNGSVVAPLTALDPSRYDLPDAPIDAVAERIFRAYGLLP